MPRTKFTRPRGTRAQGPPGKKKKLRIKIRQKKRGGRGRRR